MSPTFLYRLALFFLIDMILLPFACMSCIACVCVFRLFTFVYLMYEYLIDPECCLAPVHIATESAFLI